MKFLRTALYAFLAAILLVSVFKLLNSAKQTFYSDIHVYEENNFNILAHPEKYLDYNVQKQQEYDLNTFIFFENTTGWTEFFPGLFIHSAFSDEKTKNSDKTIIRIIAIGPKLDIRNYTLQCVFQDNETEWKYPLADFTVIRHWSFSYFTFICISKNARIPRKICLENGNNLRRSQLMEINEVNQSHISEHEIEICILPTSQNTDLQRLAEFISYYYVVGVTSFTFYATDLTEDMHRFLNMVSQSGVNVTIIPWKLTNSAVQSEQRILQTASVQHCIYRNRGKAKYVFPITTEDFLVPRQHFSLVELMNELNTVAKKKVGSYLFRQSKFCSKENITPKKNDIQLESSKKFFREDKIRLAKQRLRYMAKPKSVIEGGVHFIHKHKEGWRSASVPWQLALIHHYTSCVKETNISSFIEDRTAESFKYEILLSKPMQAFREFLSIKE